MKLNKGLKQTNETVACSKSTLFAVEVWGWVAMNVSLAFYMLTVILVFYQSQNFSNRSPRIQKNRPWVKNITLLNK